MTEDGKPYHLFMDIYGDSGDGLLMFYPHYR